MGLGPGVTSLDPRHQRRSRGVRLWDRGLSPAADEWLTRLGAAIRQISIPVACAIHGHCLGGALELALCCDFRVAAYDARLGMPEILVSLPSVGDDVMLERHIGIGRAREMILTGESITGEIALSWGLVNRVALADDVIEVAASLVRIVSAHQPDVIGAQKRLHHEWLNLPYEQGIEISVESPVDALRGELGLVPPVAVARFPDLSPRREYWVRWRHQRRRQRILVEQVFPDPQLPTLRFRIPKRGRQGPVHHLRFRDLADFEPVVVPVTPDA